MIVPAKADEQQPNLERQSPRSPAAWLPPGVLRSFVLVCGLFFLWGIPNNLNDVLIRQFMKSFEISRFQAGLVQSAFYLGYFLLALPAGLLMKRHGYKSGFLTGLILFATGCFLFLPAANSGKIRILSGRAVCDGQRTLVSGDSVEPVRRTTWPHGEFRAAAEPGAGVQSAGLHHRHSGGHRVYFLRGRAFSGAGERDASCGHLCRVSP